MATFNLGAVAPPLPDDAVVDEPAANVEGGSWARLATLLVVADILVAAGALVVVGGGILGPDLAALVLFPAWLASGVYDLGRRHRADLHAATICVATAIVAVVVCAFVSLVGTDADVAATIRWAALMATGAVAVRGLAAIAGASARRHGRALAPTLVVGAGAVGRLAARRLSEHPDHGLSVVGFVDDEPLAGPGPPVLGGLDQLESIIAERAVTTVVIGFSRATHAEQILIIRRCWALGVAVLVVPRLFEIEGTRRKIYHVGALPLVALDRSPTDGPALRGKQVVERFAALILLVALGPLMIAIALAIRVIDRHPALYRTQRIGRGGQPFTMLKFRTMRGEADLDGHADALWAEAVLGGDGSERLAPLDRRTRLGWVLRRFCVDELPQLLNILRGDMALIGPRPERVTYALRFGLALPRYDDRHRVLPGITGWAQVQGLRGETSLEDRIEWDNFYIDNWSALLDLRIVGRTVAAMLRGTDV